jgi:hypothetical protein
MPVTTPRISFGLYVIEIKQDATISTTTALQPFSNVANLKTDNVLLYPSITYEPDYWVLDGRYRFIPVDPSKALVGMMSLEMSNASGGFISPPVLEITFSQLHDTDGIGFRFSLNTGDYASEIKVDYYNGAALIISNTYFPTDVEFSANQFVSSFNRIVITFQKTSRPYRYFRLLGIDFGKLITFTGESIKSAAVIEEVDPLSTSLRVNAFNLTLFSEDEQFSILNPAGEFAALATRQPIAAYLYVDGAINLIGQFYLDTWENKSKQEIEFRAIDMAGVLDSIPHRGGMYTAVRLEDLLYDIMSAASIPYQLDPNLNNVLISGWIPYGTLRKTLQQIAFAAGAAVDCSRSWTIKIYRSRIAAQEVAAATITRSEKGMNQSIAMRPLVTGVTVIAHSYLPSTESKELFKDNLPAGLHEILFSQPMHTLSISGGTIAESGANYAIINVATSGQVILTGQTYNEITRGHAIHTPGLSISVKPNVLEVKDAYLVNPNNLVQITQRLYDYYQQRYLQKVQLFAPSVQPGDVVNIETMYGKTLRGVIEKMDTDLARGFIVNTEIIGVEHVA